MSESLFVPNNLQNKEVWLVRKLTSKEKQLAQVNIWFNEIRLTFFGNESDYPLNDYEFICKINMEI